MQWPDPFPTGALTILPGEATGGRVTVTVISVGDAAKSSPPGPVASRPVKNVILRQQVLPQVASNHAWSELAGPGH